MQGGEEAACSGGAAPGGCLVDTPPPDGYCCGRYASYWNAFLLMNKDSTQFVKQLRNLRYPVHSFSISRSCLGIYHLDFLQENHSSKYIQTVYERFYVIICVYFIKMVEGLLKPQEDLSCQILPLMNFAIVVSFIQIALCPR